MNLPALGMWMPGPLEWAAIVLVALLIFGRRLPDVARSVGKSIVEFKKGIRDVQGDIDVRSTIDSPPPSSRLEKKPEPPSNTTGSTEPSEEASTQAK